jgi:16S rRNA (cytidine1402-2'-O)-methyltransferase
VAGFAAARFRFEGFPPRKAGARKRFFEAFQEEDAPIVLFESPHRLLDTLQAALEVLGDRPVVICREMTKQFEQIFYGTLSTAFQHWQQHAPRGEFVIVLGK